MNIEAFTALALFSFASSITPGPNNLMLMSSGVNFGLAKTTRHMLGVTLGFTFMIALIGLGIMKVFDIYPWLYSSLSFICLVYLLYLAYRIAFSQGELKANKAGAKPFTFLQAALFQWVNPKAWAMGLTSITVYAESNELSAVLLVAATFGLINFPCILVWAALGTKLRYFLSTQQRLRVFNFTMAFLLLASLLPFIGERMLSEMVF